MVYFCGGKQSLVVENKECMVATQKSESAKLGSFHFVVAKTCVWFESIGGFCLVPGARIVGLL